MYFIRQENYLFFSGLMSRAVENFQSYFIFIGTNKLGIDFKNTFTQSLKYKDNLKIILKLVIVLTPDLLVL